MNTMNNASPFDEDRLDAITGMLVERVERDSRRNVRPHHLALLVSLIVGAVLISTGGTALALTGNLPFISQPPPPVVSPTPSQTPTETPTPTPTRVPTPDAPQVPAIDLSAPQTWIIGDGTVGPLSLGQSREDAKAAMTAFTKEPYQCDVDLYVSTTSRMNIVLGPDQSGASVDMILINSSNDPASPSPRTAEGIGLGSSVDEILAAYPDIQRPDPQLYPTYSLAEPDGTWIDFGVDMDTQKVIEITVMHGDYPPPEYCG